MRLASSRLRDTVEAEDVVQETVLAVWRRHRTGAVLDLDADEEDLASEDREGPRPRRRR